jgi:hypothetical protein
MFSPATIAPLTATQIAITATLGAILWLLAALLCNALGARGVFDGSARLLLYALVVPGTLPFVLLIRRVAGLAPAQTGLGMAVGTAAATLLDGVALAWFPGLYGATPALVAASGAVILWGAGVGLVLGLAASRNAR